MFSSGVISFERMFYAARELRRVTERIFRRFKTAVVGAVNIAAVAVECLGQKAESLQVLEVN